MELPKYVTRVKAGDLPKTWTECDTRHCVYNAGGLCDDPQINKGNGDAKCHRESNRSLLARLRSVPANVVVSGRP